MIGRGGNVKGEKNAQQTAGPAKPVSLALDPGVKMTEESQNVT